MSNQTGRTFQQIWKRMDRERRRQVAAAFFSSTESAGEQRRAAGLIATKLNLRPQKAAKLPAEKAAAYLSAIESIDDQLAALLVRTYLFARQKPMLVMFLDELPIPHQDGVIPDDSTMFRVPTHSVQPSIVSVPHSPRRTCSSICRRFWQTMR